MDEKIIKIREKAEEYARELNLEIFDIELKQSKRKIIVEIFIDKLDEYVSVDDCVNFSRKIEPWFEENDLFTIKYDLIVSSPGLDRPLKKIEDFTRFKDRKAKLILEEPVEKKTVIKGKIVNVDGNDIYIHDTDAKKDVVVKYENIKKANLEIEI